MNLWSKHAEGCWIIFHFAIVLLGETGSCLSLQPGKVQTVFKAELGRAKRPSQGRALRIGVRGFACDY